MHGSGKLLDQRDDEAQNRKWIIIYLASDWRIRQSDTTATVTTSSRPPWESRERRWLMTRRTWWWIFLNFSIEILQFATADMGKDDGRIHNQVQNSFQFSSFIIQKGTSHTGIDKYNEALSTTTYNQHSLGVPCSHGISFFFSQKHVTGGETAKADCLLSSRPQKQTKTCERRWAPFDLCSRNLDSTCYPTAVTVATVERERRTRWFSVWPLGFFDCCPLPTDSIGANNHHGNVKHKRVSQRISGSKLPFKINKTFHTYNVS